MPIYSHSQLSTFEECPLKYKLSYIDKIKRDVEGIEAFLGNMVHETLKKCYDDVRFTRLNTPEELLGYYDGIWQRNWHEGIVITRKDLTGEHYHALGEKLVETYYRRYAPFDADITIGTEKMLTFNLDVEGKYKMRGIIDRLARTPDGVHYIHDYKTSAHLPCQDEMDRDRQLALYQIGVHKMWPDIKDIKLVWHYLAFDRELVSCRSEEAITGLVTDTIKLIDRIESTTDFPPGESGLCNWCEYPDLCPTRKHSYIVEQLPANEYLNEPGVALVNRYAELREQAAEIDSELDKVKEALIQYARNEEVTVIKGSDRQARIKVDKKLKFPGKNEAERSGLDNAIMQAGKWPEVSQLDTTALTRIVEKQLWSADLIQQVMQFGRIEETSTIYLSKLKEDE